MSTRKLLSIACFWPGLPQLWLRGSWVGLFVAVGFTALLNVWLLAALVFYEWFALQERLFGFAVLSLTWLVAWRISVSQTRPVRPLQQGLEARGDDETEQPSVAPSPGVGEQLYQVAQQVYLQGDWVATERSLLTMLKENSKDVEARLMLATLWRRQGRLAEATRQLDRLERLEAAEKWEDEIARERAEIERINKSDDEPMVVPMEQKSSVERRETNDDTDHQRFAA